MYISIGQTPQWSSQSVRYMGEEGGLVELQFNFVRFRMGRNKVYFYFGYIILK